MLLLSGCGRIAFCEADNPQINILTYVTNLFIEQVPVLIHPVSVYIEQFQNEGKWPQS
jgi:hypothetical protein